MVITLCALLAIAAVPNEPAYLRVVYGTVHFDAAPVEAGALVDGTLETHGDGYVEFSLGISTRVRVSASTRMVLSSSTGAPRVTLESGRVWVQTSGEQGLELGLPDTRLSIAGRSSAIIEHASNSGSAVAVRSGTVLVGAVTRVRADEVIFLGPSLAGPAIVRPGGAGLARLVELEAERGIGDVLGLRDFLLRRVDQLGVARISPRSIQTIVRNDAEVTGADSGPAGLVVENALRAPPFFDEEVPPKGPNVRVEVTFGEE